MGTYLFDISLFTDSLTCRKLGTVYIAFLFDDI